MTLVGDVEQSAFANRLKRGVTLAAPPFTVRVTSPLPVLARSLHHLYAHYPLDGRDAVPDFSIRLAGTGGRHRFFRRQAMAFIDTPPPYVPLPEHMAPLMFEQALNWCVATRTYTHLVLHSAVVAKGERAIIIPGESGQGKSTLCAALVTQGWRHLSDEFALLDPVTLQVTAHPRPISLKNASIDVMRAWAPDHPMSKPLAETPKGSVAYLQPTRHALEMAEAPADPVAIVFPNFGTDAATALKPMDTARAFIFLTACSVNYREMGEAGFNAMANLVDKAPVMTATYSDTAAGVALLEELIAS